MTTSALRQETERRLPVIRERTARYLAARKCFFAGTFIFVAAILPYLHTLFGAFVWDDTVLAERYSVHTPLLVPFSRSYLGHALPGGFAAIHYRPLSALAFMMDNAIWAWNPFGYRITNLLLQAVVALLVFLLALYWLKSVRGAVIAGLFFCVQPTHDETAAWISGRCDLLAAMFMIPAYLLFATRTEKRLQWSRAILIPILYALALLSKEVALVFLPLALMDDWVKGLKWTVRRVLRDYLPLVGVTAGYLVLRRLMIGSLPSPFLDMGGFIDRITNVPAYMAAYIKIMVWPGLPAAFAPKPAIPPEYLTLWLAGSVILVYLIVRLRNVSRLGVFLIVWIALPTLMASDIVPVIGRWLCPRFVYLPTVAFCVMIAAAVDWGLMRVKNVGLKIPILALTLALLAVFGWSTVKGTDTWQTNHNMRQALHKAFHN